MTVNNQRYEMAERTANEVLQSKGNRFLMNKGSEDFVIDRRAYEVNFGNWQVLKEYRVPNADINEVNRKCIKDLVNASLTSGSAFGTLLINQHKTNYTLYGTHTRAKTKSIMNSYLPELVTNDIGLTDIPYMKNGISAGVINGELLADKVFGSGLENCYVMLICLPVHQQEIVEIISNDKSLKRFLENHVSVQRVYGNASRRVESYEIEKIRDAIAILDEEISYLEGENKNFCRAIIKFGAQNDATYNALKDIIRTVISTSNSTAVMAQFVDLGSLHSWNEIFRIPYIELENKAVNVYSLMDISNIEKLGLIPTRTSRGITVKRYEEYGNSLSVYDSEIKTDSIGGDDIEIGKGENDEIVSFNVNSLIGHTLITGITSSGKTTTVKRILIEANKKNIPFMVFESAKKEYANLIELIPDLEVYSVGTDARPFKINAMAPAEGELIENHTKALVRAICAMHGSEHPIPEAVEGLIKLSYEKMGWRYGMMACNKPERPYPTFRFVSTIIDEYIDKYANYSAEIKQNLRGVLNIRIDALANGASGELLNCNDGLQVEDLIERKVVVEFSDFSAEVASFIMNITLYKIHKYLSGLNESKNLKRLIVVEEAHNVFHKEVGNESISAVNNRYFEKMLAEIRASGTGVIICDQRVSILCGAVTANTNIKMIHSIVDKEDKNIIAGTLGLTSIQTNRLSELRNGQCIISKVGVYGQKLCFINNITLQKNGINQACLCCNSRLNCKLPAVKQLIEGLDFNKYLFHKSKICKDVYDTPRLVRDIDDMLLDLGVIANKSTRCCLLGYLLSDDVSITQHECRIILASYVNAIRG